MSLRYLAPLIAMILAGCDRQSSTPAARLQPGIWETTTRITDLNIPGHSPEQLSAATGTPTTTRDCVTPAEAARGDALIKLGAKNDGCTYQRLSLSGGKVDAAMTCAAQGEAGRMAMTLGGDYGPAAFTLRMDMKSALPGNQAMTMKARVAGKRIGACAADGGNTK